MTGREEVQPRDQHRDPGGNSAAGLEEPPVELHENPPSMEPFSAPLLNIEGHDLAGHRGEALGPVEDALRVEGAATSALTRGSNGHTEAWLFLAQSEPRTVDLSELPDLIAADENFVWVDLHDFTREDLARIASLVGLDRVSVHAAMSPWQRPRLDVFTGQCFVTVTVPRLDPGARRVEASEVDLFVGRNYLVTAHKQQLPFADRIMARSRHSPELVQLDSAFMLYLILDELLAHYEDLDHEVTGEIEATEERALQDLSEAFLNDLLHFKRYLYTLTTLAEQHRAIFRAFLRPDFPFVAGDGVDVYFRDLDARLEYLLGSLANDREAINSAFDIYVSHVSFRTNQVIKLLTIVSTVLLPITVITGLFSTTFNGVPVLHTVAGFVIMVVAIVAALAVALLIFYRRHWL